MSLRCEEAVLGSEWVVSEVLSGTKSHKADVLVVVVHFHSLEFFSKYQTGSTKSIYFILLPVPCMHCVGASPSQP